MLTPDFEPHRPGEMVSARQGFSVFGSRQQSLKVLQAVGLGGPSLDAVRRLAVLAVGAGAGDGGGDIRVGTTVCDGGVRPVADGGVGDAAGHRVGGAGWVERTVLGIVLAQMLLGVVMSQVHT